MSNPYILPVYKMLFLEDYDNAQFEHRQKLINSFFLLREKGIPVSEYGFLCTSHGLKSIDLYLDAEEVNKDAQREIVFSKEISEEINKLSHLLHDIPDSNTSINDWVNALALVYYVKEFIAPYGAAKDEVINKVSEHVTHNVNKDLLHHAYDKLVDFYQLQVPDKKSLEETIKCCQSKLQNKESDKIISSQEYIR